VLHEFAKNIVPPIVTTIELIGVAIIGIGAAVTLAWFLYQMIRRVPFNDAIVGFRSSLGRAILLGLEFLVAADIINTVVIELNLENVASLAIIVLIRTLLSFSLEAEIDGRWPWQRRSQERKG
jgi:uncharacterized membrane protein